MSTAADQLTSMLAHHHAHTLEKGDNLPFLNVYVGPEQFLQFSYGTVGVYFSPEEATTQKIKAHLDQRDTLTFERGLGWKLDGGDDWNQQEAYDIIETLLSVAGHEVTDITRVVEIDGPNQDTVEWDDL